MTKQECASQHLLEQKFPKEKILSVSASDYCKSKGKKLSSYEMIGVHGSDSGLGSNFLERFIEKVPSRAEVVVNYRAILTKGEFSTPYFYGFGTALLPK